MHKGMVGIIVIKSGENTVVGNGDSVSQIAACQGFPQHQNIRLYHISNKAVSCPAKACGNFVKNEKHTILVTKLSGTFQKRNIIHAHTAGTLQKRFYNHAVQFLVIFCKSLFQCVYGGWNVYHMGAFAVGVQHKVIIRVIAYLHGFEGVPVVGMFQCQDHGALGVTLIDVILQCHF